MLAQQMVSAACAAAFSSTIMNPLDIARTRIQVAGLQANATGRGFLPIHRSVLLARAYCALSDFYSSRFVPSDFCDAEDTNARRGTAAVLHEVKMLIRNEGFRSLSKGRARCSFPLHAA